MIRVLLFVATAFAVGTMIGPSEVAEVAREWRLPKGLRRTKKSQQNQNEGEKKQWFPY